MNEAAPGGDAHDPHVAALERQLGKPWGYRRDKDDQVVFPLPDWRNWKRVRYWTIEHFVGFRYGDDFHVLTVGLVHPVPAGEAGDSEGCLRRAEQWARPQWRSFEVAIGPIEDGETTWQKQKIPTRRVDGHVDFALDRIRFSAGWAALPMYEGACFVYSVAVPWRDHPEQARRVRDRFLAEGVPHVRALTKEPPVRK